MGPMTAAVRFVQRPAADRAVEIKLYASLALTGRGHATGRAVILGLAAFQPAGMDPEAADLTVNRVEC